MRFAANGPVSDRAYSPNVLGRLGNERTAVIYGMIDGRDDHAEGGASLRVIPS
jgi:hypothetical protein